MLCRMVIYLAGRACLPAPKVKLPTNIDSYNPPPEYDCAEVVKSIGHSVVQKIDLGSQVALRAVGLVLLQFQ
jgi:hypothetical protein